MLALVRRAIRRSIQSAAPARRLQRTRSTQDAGAARVAERRMHALPRGRWGSSARCPPLRAALHPGSNVSDEVRRLAQVD